MCCMGNENSFIGSSKVGWGVQGEEKKDLQKPIYKTIHTLMLKHNLLVLHVF